MMTTITQSPASLAISRAVAEAEIRRFEMSRNLSAEQVSTLLQRQADAAAASPLPYDQLLALALSAAARPETSACPTLDALRAPADRRRRLEIAREVFASGPTPNLRAVLKAAPDWELQRASRRIGRRALDQAAWLRAAASLARSLWDHPALPATPAFRSAILACAAVLDRRAEELATGETEHAPPALRAGAGKFEEA